MTMSMRELQRAAWVLIKDRSFAKTYVLCAATGVNPRASQRRTKLGNALGTEHEHSALDRETLRRYLDMRWKLPEAKHGTDNGATNYEGVVMQDFWSGTALGKFEVPVAEPAECEYMDTRDYALALDLWEAAQRVAGAYPEPLSKAKSKTPTQPETPTEKETTMSAIQTTPITITTQVLVNGTSAANYDDARLFAMIAQSEAEINVLKAIESKPAALNKQIVKLQAGIAALVEYMDKRDAKGGE